MSVPTTGMKARRTARFAGPSRFVAAPIRRLLDSMTARELAAILRRVKLSVLVPPAQIRVPLAARTKAAAIDELLAAIPFDTAERRAAARIAVTARESEISTGIGRGVAIPHGRTSAVTRHHCAFGVAPAGIAWDAIDAVPCRILFLCVSAE